MEGFLSLEQAAERLETSIEQLSRDIDDGRVVAILREGQPWLSLGEISRLQRGRVERPNPAPTQKTVPRPEPQPSPQKPASQDRVESPQGELQQLTRLNQRLAEEKRELEELVGRLKSGLQETEATLRRSRTARANLENDIVALQDQLNKSRSRNDALEREIQHLTTELEKAEEQYNSSVRRLRSKDRKAEPFDNSGSENLNPEVDHMRAQMSEKDRIIASQYQERGQLRAQLEDNQQKYYELKARYEKEKTEWSEILAREIQNHGHLRQQLEELKPKASKGWNPFRRER